MDEMPTEFQMDAFKRGMEAYTRGVELDDNPYPQTSRTSNYDFWMFGWQSAHQDWKDRVTNPR